MKTCSFPDKEKGRSSLIPYSYCTQTLLIIVFWCICWTAHAQIEWAYGVVESSMPEKSGKDFGPDKVLGEPDAFPSTEISPLAWTIDFVVNGATEEVKVMFETPIPVLKIFLVENYGIGPKEVQLFDETDKLRERFIINENFDLSLMIESKVSYILFYKKTPYKVRYIKVISHAPWNGDSKCQLDGIGIAETDAVYPLSEKAEYSVLSNVIKDEPSTVVAPFKKSYTLKGRITDLKTGQGIKDAEVVLVNVADGTRFTKLSSEEGLYEFNVSENQYVISVQKPNFVSIEKILISTLGFPQAHDFNAPLYLRAFDATNKIILNDIQFDLNSDRIIESSLPILDNLVKTLKNYSDSYIYVGVHTDSRGEDAYNLKLSEERAKTVYNYLISKGIEAGRIQAKGYGETQLTNYCANNVLCNNRQHLANRRVEILLSNDPPQDK